MKSISLSKLKDVNLEQGNVGTIIHLGAGNANEMKDYRELSPKKIVLVEAVDKLAKKLQKKYKDDPVVDIKHSLVSADSNDISFTKTIPNRYSSIGAPGLLLEKLPNLSFESSGENKAVSIDSIVSSYNLKSEESNVLVVQLNGFSDTLIRSMDEQYFTLFSHIIIQCPFAGAYLEQASGESISEFLRTLGFKMIDKFKSDSVFSDFIFNKDVQIMQFIELQKAHDVLQKSYAEQTQQLNTTKTEVNDLAEENKKLKESESRNNENNKVLELKLTNLEADYNVISKDIDSLKSELADTLKKEQVLTSREKEITSLLNLAEEKVKTLSAELTKQKQECDLVKKELEQVNQKYELLKKEKDTLSVETANTLMKQLASQGEAMEKLKNDLSWKLESGLNNSVKQIESYIGVQNALEGSDSGLDFHGWPISSDIALFLLNKIKMNNYDVIIEFGSGTSTQMFAKMLSNLCHDSKAENEGLVRISGDNNGNAIKLSETALPKHIVTFEHSKKYYNKTLEALNNNDLERYVDLVHAPLVDYVCEGKDYLYYSCDKKLEQLARIFEGRTAKILVLIDGPPGVTGPLARFPAVSKLLNSLGEHQFDLVLDDYNRREEKETADLWKKQFEARYISYDEEFIPCEKGAFFCRINS